MRAFGVSVLLSVVGAVVVAYDLPFNICGEEDKLGLQKIEINDYPMQPGTTRKLLCR